MRIRVWVDGWQMQCCGTPFSDGDTVEWTLYERSDGELLETTVGRQVAQTVNFAEEHHGGLPDGAPETTGRVVRIQAFRCRFAPTGGRGSRINGPVPGSGELALVHRADGWDPPSGDLRFNGYLVDLEVEQTTALVH